MKKVFTRILTAVFAVICTVSVALTFLLLGSLRYLKRTDNMVPVESITGINTPATLKNGCYIKEGLTYDDGLGVILNMAVCMPGQEGLAVSSIRIIDVYGSECTIAFNFADGYRCLIKDNYPLSNLDYDDRKVREADDGIKSDIYRDGIAINGHRNYIRNSPVRISPAIWVLGIIGVAVLVSAVVRKFKKPRSA